jgi:hypothetical protein
MEYRNMDSGGREAFDNLLALSGYYSPVATRKLEGIALGAYDGERLVAGVWCALTGVRAYLDYLVVDPEYPGTSIRLLAWMAPLLAELGAEEVRFEVSEDNDVIHKISKVLRAEMSGPYYTGIYKLGVSDGYASNDHQEQPA